MSKAEIIDQIFADALTQMAPETVTLAEQKEQTVSTESGMFDEDLPPAADKNTDDEDLDALLESLTSGAAAPADGQETNGDLDQVLDEMFPSDAVVADNLEDAAPGAGTEALDDANDDLLNSAMQIEDMPAPAEPGAENPSEETDEAALAAMLGETSADNDAADAVLGDLSASLPETDDAVADMAAADAADPESPMEAVAPEAADEGTASAAEELNETLKAMGLEGDNSLLYNDNSSDKERLLAHLASRFDFLARKKLENLPAEQVRLVKSVNLRVDIELKFGEFSTSGDDDSIFQLDI